MVFIRKLNGKCRPSTRNGYILPFENNGVNIFQGYNGRFSHSILEFNGSNRFTHDDRFSVDFALPLGTPIVASKDGIVDLCFDKSDDFYDGLDIFKGIMLWTNSLYLNHFDETFTLYSHLGKGSLKVEKGEFVKKGQIIAYTGKSGWIGPTPHIHFSALRFENSLKKLHRRSFPIIFDNYSGSLEDFLIR